MKSTKKMSVTSSNRQLKHDIMIEQIKAKIIELTQERKGKVHPEHITLHQLTQAMPEIKHQSIALAVFELEQAGVVETGDTINSRWIKIK